jgi:hypothetical protein
VKKVLIVVSTWKPCMMADMQRARLIAGELPNFGWEAEILAPDTSFQTDFSRLQGEGLEFPEVPVHEVAQWQSGFFRRVGSRNIGLRAAVPVGRAGLELLRAKHFDAVYFSTAQHWLTCNGARWRQRTGVPYIADLHDPVYLEKKVYFVSRHRVKERIAKHLGKRIERLAIGRADGLVSVSEGYVEQVARRYPEAPWCERGCVLTQPFPADLLALDKASQSLPPRTEQGFRILYIGAGGNIMEKGWRELLRCLQAEGMPEGVRLDLMGTDTEWRTNRRRYLKDIADQTSLSKMVSEEPARIAYRDSIALTIGADGLLILGVDDPNYRPSKLQTCIATGLPVLILTHSASSFGKMTDRSGPGIHIVSFGDEGRHTQGNREAVRRFLGEVTQGRRWSRTKGAFLSPWDAAAGHAELFNRVAAGRGA